MSLFRVALVALSAVSTGITVGRRAASREVDRQKKDIIARASVEARERIRERTKSLINATTGRFLRRVLFKALILSAIWLTFWGGLIDAGIFRTAMAVAIGGLVLFDLLGLWPTLQLIGMEVRKHGLRPKRAISEMVAAQVFDEVLTEIDARHEAKWHQRLVLGLAGRDMSQMSLEIAAAVADTARQTSWADMRPFLLGAVLRFGIVAALYSAFATLIMFRASIAD